MAAATGYIRPIHDATLVSQVPEATPRLALDIRGQSASLARVLDQQCGAGRTQLRQAAALLRRSKRVVITGIGASLNAAIPLESFLSSRGIGTCSIEAGELLHYRSAACQDATVAVISRSGESIEIAMLLEALRGRVPIVGVTHEPRSPLAREADVVLEVCSLPDEMVAIQSYTGTLLALYLLGMETVDQLDAGCREAHGLLPALARWTDAQLQALRDWDGFLASDSCVHLLGRGPSCASAWEGALLFGEVAKAPAIAMAVASFRHGPIEVVDRSFRGFVFAPSGKTRDLNIGLAADVMGFGGSVRLIGPAGVDGHGLPWIETPPCPDILAPLVEIVPIQVAAMRLAELRGLAPGSFRYISQITRDERALGRSPATPANG
ncbi:MAG TPA: SIS domain-containing protein [Steroidobacteraceae bacterium]|nr:SIS domain-containing protein [Steroidobacteraceae bacterium]